MVYNMPVGLKTHWCNDGLVPTGDNYITLENHIPFGVTMGKIKQTAISSWVNKNIVALAYIKGVLDGDGYIDYGGINPRLCLETTCWDNAKNFSEALKIFNLTPRQTERDRIIYSKHPRFKKRSYHIHVFVVRATCKLKFIRLIESEKFLTEEEKIAYIRGFYESEGWLSIDRYPNRICYDLCIKNSNKDYLRNIQNMLSDLGIKVTIREYPNLVPYLQTQQLRNIQKFFTIIFGRLPNRLSGGI